MITTNVTTGENFYVHAENPEGPWSEPIVIPGWGGIDPDLFFDDDGRVYLTGTNYYPIEPEAIYQAEIDLATGQVIGERKKIWDGTGGCCPEGPHIYKINGWYYLMIAEGGTEYGHMETIARSKRPDGPYEASPYNPIMSNRENRLLADSSDRTRRAYPSSRRFMVGGVPGDPRSCRISEAPSSRPGDVSCSGHLDGRRLADHRYRRPH